MLADACDASGIENGVRRAVEQFGAGETGEKIFHILHFLFSNTSPVILSPLLTQHRELRRWGSNSMANILIVGADQGIGYYLVERLLEVGNSVTVLDRQTDQNVAAVRPE